MDQKDEQKQKGLERLVIENTLLMENKVRLCLGLLKMQEQLLEREHAVLNKQQTIQAAQDSKRALENYRSILKQKLGSLKRNKDIAVRETDQKQTVLEKMFRELVAEIEVNRGCFAQNKKLVSRKIFVQSELECMERNMEELGRKKDLVSRRVSSLLPGGGKVRKEQASTRNSSFLPTLPVVRIVAWIYGRRDQKGTIGGYMLLYLVNSTKRLPYKSYTHTNIHIYNIYIPLYLYTHRHTYTHIDIPYNPILTTRTSSNASANCAAFSKTSLDRNTWPSPPNSALSNTKNWPSARNSSNAWNTISAN